MNNHNCTHDGEKTIIKVRICETEMTLNLCKNCRDTVEVSHICEVLEK